MPKERPTGLIHRPATGWTLAGSLMRSVAIRPSPGRHSSRPCRWCSPVGEDEIRRAALGAIDRLAGTDMTTLLAGICRDATWKSTGRAMSLEVLCRRELRDLVAWLASLRDVETFETNEAAEGAAAP